MIADALLQGPPNVLPNLLLNSRFSPTFGRSRDHVERRVGVDVIEKFGVARRVAVPLYVILRRANIGIFTRSTTKAKAAVAASALATTA